MQKFVLSLVREIIKYLCKFVLKRYSSSKTIIFLLLNVLQIFDKMCDLKQHYIKNGSLCTFFVQHHCHQLISRYLY